MEVNFFCVFFHQCFMHMYSSYHHYSSFFILNFIAFFSLMSLRRRTLIWSTFIVGSFCNMYFLVIRLMSIETNFEHSIFPFCTFSRDLATLSEEGLLKIVGRVKDMVIRGGENVYPTEIENVLHTCPIVAEAHVCGVPDKRLGEEICAWVLLKRGQKVVQTEEFLANFCAGEVCNGRLLGWINLTVFPFYFHALFVEFLQKFK